jgi:hypothetical protein
MHTLANQLQVRHYMTRAARLVRLPLSAATGAPIKLTILLRASRSFAAIETTFLARGCRQTTMDADDKKIHQPLRVLATSFVAYFQLASRQGICEHSASVVNFLCFARLRIRHTYGQDALRHTPHAIRHTPYAIRHTPYVGCPMPHAIRRTPYATRHT